MRFYFRFLVFILIAAAIFGCSTARQKSLTPLETLKAYGSAYKKKDFTAMKLLLSQETLQMHEQEAKARNETLDDVVKRETLFSENQTTAEFRNEKTEDDKATVEMKDSLGIWNTVHFVREDGAWKIDRKGEAEKIEQNVEQKQNELDNIINQGRINDANLPPPGNANTPNSDAGNPPPIANTNQPAIDSVNKQP